MNRSSIAVFGLCAACAAFGEDTTQLAPKVEVSKTETAEFPPNGTLRLQKSTGELTIEGWDQSTVEITTNKSTRTVQAHSDHDKVVQELDRVNVTTKRDGNELIVTTGMPTHRAFPFFWPLSVVRNFDLEYRIKVPRNAKLIVKHEDGEVHIDDVTGNIAVTARQGLIALHLSGDGPRSVDARTDYGSVNSDFPGKETRHPFPFGHEFEEAPSTTLQSVHLRIGYGDIVLLKAHDPQAPASVVAQK